MARLFRPRALLGLAAALVVASGAVAAGTMLRDDEADRGAAPRASKTSTVATSSTTTTTAPPPAVPASTYGLLQPPPAELPPLPPGGLGPEASGSVVQAYEQRMADVKLDPGAVDGVWDQATTYAVHGLQHFRGAVVTGRIDDNDRFALNYFKYPPPLQGDGEPNHTEIDITRGVLVLYEGGQVRMISTISTGSGENYCYNSPRDNPTERICEDANTPSGRYTYYYFYNGWHKSPLGQLYNPFYFNKGIAVHGYEEVPPYPASHGCVRIPMHTAEYFHSLVHSGDAVYVFGGVDANITSRRPLGGGPAPEGPPPEPVPPPGEPAPPPA